MDRNDEITAHELNDARYELGDVVTFGDAPDKRITGIVERVTEIDGMPVYSIRSYLGVLFSRAMWEISGRVDDARAEQVRGDFRIYAKMEEIADDFAPIVRVLDARDEIAEYAAATPSSVIELAGIRLVIRPGERGIVYCTTFDGRFEIRSHSSASGYELVETRRHLPNPWRAVRLATAATAAELARDVARRLGCSRPNLLASSAWEK